MSRSETTLRIPGEAPTQRVGSSSQGRVVLGRYRLDERIGVGGFGVVWRAHDVKLRRDVAVKAVPIDRGTADRAEREAVAAARLNHPGIVTLYEFGHDDHDAFLVSELVEGATLAELRREQALSDRDVARVGAALCEALAHAHARGVVHRDIKPGNVMVVAEPAAGEGFAKLMDFGIAQVATADSLTATGDIVGTLAYMAPEQAEGRRAAPESDVYSLALTLYEGWTGSNPVRAESPAATARRLGSPLPALRSQRRDLPPGLCEVVDAALDPDPAVRPDLAELGEMLRDAEAELSDVGGLVEPETIERFGLTTVEAATGSTAVLPLGPPQPTPRRVDAVQEPEPVPWATAIWSRIGAGLAAGAVVLLAFEQLASPAPMSPLTAAAVTAAAVGLLPRVGWIAAGLAVGAWLASPSVGQEGTALLIAAALIPVPLLLPRAGPLWSVPILAPLLGVIALAPMFVAIAAAASTPARRAGLGAAGFLWLVFAEILTGDVLLFGPPPEVTARAAWEGSVVDVTRDVLLPLATSPALLPAAAFAGFAVLLPLAIRGRSVGLDVLAGAAWAAGLVIALDACGDLMAGVSDGGMARGAVVGSILGAAAAVAVRTIVPRQDADRRPPPHYPDSPIR